MSSQGSSASDFATSQPGPASSGANLTPTCTDNLRFLADLTVPDGSLIANAARILQNFVL